MNYIGALVFGYTAVAFGQNTVLLDFTSPNSLPSCAQACTPLYSAQGACVPPTAPTASVDVYKSCFCKSSFLQPLYASPSGLCDSACPAASLAQMRNWFLGQCNQQQVTSTTTPTTTTSPPQPTAAGAKPASASNVSTTGPGGQSWWDNHWKWVLMLIIVFLAIVAASVGGVLYRRRRKRKAAAAAMSTPIAWGPHQHQHFTQGHASYAAGPPNEFGGTISEKGKGKGRVSKAPPS